MEQAIPRRSLGDPIYITSSTRIPIPRPDPEPICLPHRPPPPIAPSPSTYHPHSHPLDNVYLPTSRIPQPLSVLLIPLHLYTCGLPIPAQAYHSILPYHRFALFFDPSDLRRLPQLLRDIPPRRICDLRAAAARYYRALVWEEPDGLAFEVLQLSLCRRAAALHRMRRGAGGQVGSVPSWAIACERKSALEELLDTQPLP